MRDEAFRTIKCVPNRRFLAQSAFSRKRLNAARRSANRVLLSQTQQNKFISRIDCPRTPWTA